MSEEEGQAVTDTTTEIVQDATSESVTTPAPEPPRGDRSAAAANSPDANALDIVIDVPLKVTVEIGSARMRVKEVLQLSRGSVVPLDRMSGDPADILANGRVIARGELTIVEDRLAIRVTQLMGGAHGDGAA